MKALATQGLGTQLRHLVELLDGGVDEIYKIEGLDYRPRYTPIVRALENQSALTIKSIAKSAGISHSAASQTISKMISIGLLEHAKGKDGRERLIRLTNHARSILPRLHHVWRATQIAADELDAELAIPLSEVAEQAIIALSKKSFVQRIAEHVSTQLEGVTS